jgi:hypothetical protein
MFGSSEASETQTSDAWIATSTTEHPGLAVLKILFLAMMDVMSGTILHFLYPEYIAESAALEGGARTTTN